MSDTTALRLPEKPSIAVLPFQNMSGDPGPGLWPGGQRDNGSSSARALPCRGVALYRGGGVDPDAGHTTRPQYSAILGSISSEGALWSRSPNDH
jgi:hypothetical protein